MWPTDVEFSPSGYSVILLLLFYLDLCLFFSALMKYRSLFWEFMHYY